MYAILSTDLLVGLEQMLVGHRQTQLILPARCDEEQALQLLLQDAVGCREVELVLLERQISDLRQELSSLLGIELSDEDIFSEDVEVPAEGFHLRMNLNSLLTERASLERDLAQLRGPEGEARARRALARCNLVPVEATPRTALSETAPPAVRLTSGSYGLCDTMEERLRVRGWSLDLPEGHEESRLREDELAKWQPSAGVALDNTAATVPDWPALLRSPPKNLVLSHELGLPHDPSSIYGRELLAAHADGSLELRVWQGNEEHRWQAKIEARIWSRWAELLAESAFPDFPQQEMAGGASFRIFAATVGSSSVRAELSRYHFEDEPPYAELCAIADSICAQVRGRECWADPDPTAGLVRSVRKIEL